MRALRVSATLTKHVNMLRHIMGLFEDRLSAGEKRELLGVIGDYTRERVPLVVPITLINHHISRLEVARRTRRS